jgi:hypothetical protein
MAGSEPNRLCLNLIYEARNTRSEPERKVCLTEEESSKLIAVIGDLAGILNSNLDLIADAHGG